MKAIVHFSTGTSPLSINNDQSFRTSLSNGATPKEYWEANEKGVDMDKYAQLRAKNSHGTALRTLDIPN